MPVAVTHHGARYATETPDGQWLFICDGRHLVRMHPDGSGETLVRDGVYTNLWTMGGSGVYVIDDNSNDLLRAPFGGTVFEKVLHFDDARAPAGGGNCLALPRDESYLIYRSVVRSVNTLMLLDGLR
ncbi:hypothetical protein SBA3_230027 [Candidatus Sulfopaludibacter sp. SbA3]|nr:hypothetical protein SBA3_230027 [Candidatus Sulfopaludibacter sp. SbA3]